MDIAVLPPVPHPKGSCLKGALLAWPGLCNTASFDRHGPFGVGGPSSGCVV